MPSEHAALQALPRTIIWAWERPEDLRWLPTQAGVAYVATSLLLTDARTEVRPRHVALLVRPDTVLIPVIHVDASARHPPVLSTEQRDQIVTQVLRIATATDASVVQLDFEVRLSQRAFLLDVVQRIRKQLPADRALSMTALASWCAGDYWLAQMPADEIVPMVFRMARDDASIRSMLLEQGHFPRRPCRAAAGFAIDETMPIIQDGRHYYFSPKSWMRKDWSRIPYSAPSHMKRDGS